MSLDAIVVLGCRLRPGGRLSPAAARRAERAAEAYHAGLAPVLVVSGGRRWHGVPEAAALRQELVKLGVSETALVTECCSLSTCENARYAKPLLESRGASKVGVVTCDWHMPRALLAFRRAKLEPLPLAAPSPNGSYSRTLIRSLRERISWYLDCFATWGI
jgi:uncharacterized SAM-binding protein YcdF (DUF218 family)